MPDEGERREQFTDDEAAFLRHVRFGELPGRVVPAEMVELVETDAPRLPERRAFDPYDPATGSMIR